MTETPRKGRGGVHAALPLASSATDRNLRACLFWDVVFLLHSASSYKCFFLLCKVHDGSHSKKAEAKEATLLGLGGCPLGGPVGTERYVPGKGIKRRGPEVPTRVCRVARARLFSLSLPSFCLDHRLLYLI